VEHTHTNSLNCVLDKQMYSITKRVFKALEVGVGVQCPGSPAFPTCAFECSSFIMPVFDSPPFTADFSPFPTRTNPFSPVKRKGKRANFEGTDALNERWPVSQQLLFYCRSNWTITKGPRSVNKK